MGSEQKLWEDMTPTERLAAITELAEQVQALRGDKALRQKTDKAQPIQLQPSVCSRLGRAFLSSAASPLDHSTARFSLSQHPAWNFSLTTEGDAGSYRQQSYRLIDDVTDCKFRAGHRFREAENIRPAGRF